MEFTDEVPSAFEVMSASTEQYLLLWDILLTNFEFWLTVTFAGVVAIHALGSKVNNRLAWTIGLLYSGFALHTLLSSLTIITQIFYVLELGEQAATALNNKIPPNPFGEISLYWFGAFFLIGSTLTTIFILKSPKRYGDKNNRQDIE